MRRAPFSSPTLVLLLVNVATFVGLSLAGNGALMLLAQTGTLFFSGYYWQVFTAMFIHFGWLNLIFDMYGLFYFGRLNEITYGRSQYLAIYVAAGLLGNLLSLFLIPLDAPTAGASGAIFGLVGSYVAIEHRGVNVLAALLYAVLILASSTGPGLDIVAHLSGVAVGFIAGLLLSDSTSRSSSVRSL